MGHYEIPELKELENLSREYAKKFNLEMGELEAEFDVQVKIGDALIKDVRNISDKVRERFVGRGNAISFNDVCLNVSVWGNQHYVISGNIEKIDKYLSKLRRKNPDVYEKILAHIWKIEYLVRTLKEIRNMAKAHLFLQTSTPRSLLFR